VRSERTQSSSFELPDFRDKKIMKKWSSQFEEMCEYAVYEERRISNTGGGTVMNEQPSGTPKTRTLMYEVATLF
jgi:hypothetical protein